MGDVSKPKRIAVVVLLMLTSLLTGCWDALPVEKRTFVTALGVDWLPEAPHLQVTIVHPLMEERRARENRVLTMRADSLSGAFAMWNHTNAQHLSLGVLSVLVIGRQAAEQPLSPIINDLCAHPDLRFGAYVIVAQDTAQELLSVEPPHNQLIAVHLRNVLERAVFRRDAPPTTLDQFITHMMTPGMDAITALVAPIGTLDHREKAGQGAAVALAAGGQQAGGGGATRPEGGGEDVQIAGAVLWQGDVWAGELTLAEAQFVYMAKGLAARMWLEVRFPPDERLFPDQDTMVLSIEAVSTRWRLDLVQGVPHFELLTQVRLSLHNYAGGVDMSKKENSLLLEEIVADTLEQNMLLALQSVAATGSDPLSLGQFMRIRHPKEWDSKEWREKIRSARFTVTAQAEIRNIGLELLRLEPVNK